MSDLLLCASPYWGHVAPTIAVARHLLQQGHDVRFLTGTRFRDAVEAAGAAFLPLPPEADIDDSRLDVIFPERAALKGPKKLRFDIDAAFLNPAPSQVAAIEEAMRHQAVDAIVADCAFVGAGVMAARADRPPVVSLGVVPLMLGSVDVAPYGLGLAPRPGPLGRLRNRALTVLAQRVIFAANQRHWQQIARELAGRETDVWLFDWCRLADAMVQLTVPEFEYPRPDAPDTLHFVGPVSRTVPSSTPLPIWWGDLDDARRVVHVTQGTVANHDWDELVAPTLRALADEDCLVVVSTGNRPLDTLPPLPANARAAEFLPYDRLLPRLDVMVTNGGYGGVHWALEHGVPLVVAGTSEDKAEVNARVAWSGAGVDLKTDVATSDAVRAGVRKVLADPSYRDASRRIAVAIAAAPGLPGLTALVEALVADGAPAGAR